MSLKAFNYKGKDTWDMDTYSMKHPSNPKDAKRLRQAVKEMKKLAHRNQRIEGKREINEAMR